MPIQQPKLSEHLKETADFGAYAVACAREETLVRGVLAVPNG